MTVSSPPALVIRHGGMPHRIFRPTRDIASSYRLI